MVKNTNATRYFVIAGEASGDLHGANLVKAIKQYAPDAHFEGFGGDLMAEQGVQLRKHYKELDFMGFIEVLLNIRTIFKNLDFCKQCILAAKVDTIILIDYPGFNLRIAPFAKALGIKVVYYISPQIWAWKQNRVFKIKEVVDQMLVILPFEKDFYAKFGITVDFVGHPLLDAIAARANNAAAFRERNNLDEQPIIALLPGSRKQEIKVKLPIMAAMQAEFPTYQFVVAKVKNQPEELYQKAIQGTSLKLVEGDTYALLENATAALVTSGTATLETALFEVPEVVCYKGSYFSYLIAKQLIKVKYISLVNLIADKELVKELIQEEYNTKQLKLELAKILNAPKAKALKQEYKQLKQLLGGIGASDRAAKLILGID